MEYYKLIYDYENSDDAIFVTIDEKKLPFNIYDVNGSVPLNITKIYVSVTHDNKADYDYVANDLGWLVVSEKIRKVFEQSYIGKHEFIPLVNEKTDEVVGYLVHCMNVIEGFDEKNAICDRKTYVINGKTYENLIVVKYAINKEQVGKSDMFKLKESNIPYFISDSLKARIEKVKGNGFDYVKVKTI